MNKRFLRTIFCFFLNTALLFTLSGCQTAPLAGSGRPESNTSTPLLPETLMKALIQTSELRDISTRQHPVTVPLVRNETARYVDTRLLTDEILRALIQASIPYRPVLRTLTSETGHSGVRLEGIVSSSVQTDAQSTELRTVESLALYLIENESGKTLWSGEAPLPAKR